MPDTQRQRSRTPFLHLCVLCACAVILLSAARGARAQEHIPTKVQIEWNRFYDYDETTNLLEKLVAAHPDLLTKRSLGRSEQGRELWLVILNNGETGPHEQKPAMYIDGNVHGNEIQATETVMYTIWYLTKSYGEVPPLTALVDRVAFYFVPMVNPDGRDFWFDEPNNPHSSRSGQRPTDNDFDGELDEDGPDDLDGDGHIGSMWRFDPNGGFRRNQKDPRIIERVGPDEAGELSFAGSEGVDNDGDGSINEDGPGGYDMNRNWPSGWQPNYVQFGAGEYPFDRPETRAIGDFINDRSNIAAGQSYHNAGGMILRGPGAPHRGELYPRGDTRTYDALGEAGEELLPFYNYWIIHADLYTVHGGFVNWLAEGLGIVSFTNELWTERLMLPHQEGRMDDEAEMRWRDRMMFGQTFTDWTEHDHPTLGRMLIGGGNKFDSRNPPGFMLEQEAHRNFAFTMFHAENMPLLSFPWTEVKKLGDDLWQVTVEVRNDKIIPSRLELAAMRKIGLRDRLSLEGEGIEVIASGPLSDRFDRTIAPIEHRPQVIPVDDGIPGRSVRAFRFLITGAAGAEVRLRYEAEKAHDIEQTITLRDESS